MIKIESLGLNGTKFKDEMKSKDRLASFIPGFPSLSPPDLPFVYFLISSSISSLFVYLSYLFLDLPSVYTGVFTQVCLPSCVYLVAYLAYLRKAVRVNEGGPSRYKRRQRTSEDFILSPQCLHFASKFLIVPSHVPRRPFHH